MTASGFTSSAERAGLTGIAREEIGRGDPRKKKGKKTNKKKKKEGKRWERESDRDGGGGMVARRGEGESKMEKEMEVQ